jgi:hypothetical protein
MIMVRRARFLCPFTTFQLINVLALRPIALTARRHSDSRLSTASWRQDTSTSLSPSSLHISHPSSNTPGNSQVMTGRISSLSDRRFARGIFWASSTRRTLMMGVYLVAPLEVIDLHICNVTDYAAIQQFSEIVVVVWGPTALELVSSSPKTIQIQRVVRTTT